MTNNTNNAKETPEKQLSQEQNPTGTSTGNSPKSLQETLENLLN
jgi:hypothetical protein